MPSLFDQIRLDILKHKDMVLTEDEIDALPPLDIEIDKQEFLEWLFKEYEINSKINSKIKRMTETEKIAHCFNKKAQQLGLTGKSLESYVKSRLIIWEREQRQKAADEAKMLGTAMQQLLPDIFDDKRAIPNCFLRGALFGMVRKGRRALVGDMPIFTMSQYDLTFTGYELDQNHYMTKILNLNIIAG